MGYLYISKLLCTFAIERKKKEIEDFLRIVKFTGLSQKEIEKRLDYLLDDLSRLMKNRK